MARQMTSLTDVMASLFLLMMDPGEKTHDVSFERKLLLLSGEFYGRLVASS